MYAQKHTVGNTGGSQKQEWKQGRKVMFSAGPKSVLLTCRFVGETMVTKEYMRSGAASNRSGRASFIASSSADDAWAGTPYHT